MISCCVLLFQTEFFNLSFKLLLFFISKLVKSVCLWLVDKLFMSDSLRCFTASLVCVSRPPFSSRLVPLQWAVASSTEALSALFWNPWEPEGLFNVLQHVTPHLLPFMWVLSLSRGGCDIPELTHLPCQPYHSALGVCWSLLTFPVLDSLGEWRLMWTEVIGLYHLCAEAVQAGNAAPPSPTLVCNCAGSGSFAA